MRREIHCTAFDELVDPCHVDLFCDAGCGDQSIGEVAVTGQQAMPAHRGINILNPLPRQFLLEVGSGEPGGEDGYLYPLDYFEPFTPNLATQATATVTLHVPPDLKQVLHAEALDSGRPVSKLMREWVEAQLDLAANGQPA